MAETEEGDVVGLEIDQDHKDLLHVTVRITVSANSDLERWRDRLGESINLTIEDA